MKRRRGFTLLELLVVIVIIGILAGLLIPIGRMLMNRRAEQAANALVQAVAAAIASYSTTTWLVTGPVRRSYPWLWDMNVPASGGRTVGDGLIDGYPAAAADAEHDGPFEAGLIASGYAGFVRMAMPGLTANSRQINARGQPIDSWGSPLRIAFGGSSDGAAGFRVWSIGPDKVDQDGQGDDLGMGRRP